MLIQSVIFFVLGIAVVAFSIALISPILWKRMLILAKKSLKKEIPYSLEEMKMRENFLKAQHAINIVHEQERYSALEKLFDEQKIKFDATQYQLRRLNQLEQRTQQMEAKIKLYKDMLENERQVIEYLNKQQTKNMEKMEHLTVNEKDARLNIALHEKKMEELKQKIEEIAKQSDEVNHQDTLQSAELLNSLRQELKDFTRKIMNDYQEMKEQAEGKNNSFISPNENENQNKIKKEEQVANFILPTALSR